VVSISIGFLPHKFLQEQEITKEEEGQENQR
jgi:hypothetical protein